MKVYFDYDAERECIVFYGNGIEVSKKAENCEEIISFAKSVTEHYIKSQKAEQEEKKKDNSHLFYLLLDMMSKCGQKNYYNTKTGEVYKGQVVLNCGKITDNFGNELIFM